jgi:predicted permease
MDEWLKVVSATAAVFAVVILGFGIRRAKLLTTEADESLLKLVIWVLVPALILHILIDNEAMRQPANLLIPPVIGFGAVAVGIGLAWWVAHLLGAKIGLDTPAKQRTFAVSVGIFNYGYIPIPLAEALHDQSTLGVLFVHNVGVDVAMWTLGVGVLSRRLGKGWWKGVINPPLIAIVVAVSLNFLNAGEVMPRFVERAIGMLAVCAIPIALIMIGATMADHFKSSDLKSGHRMMATASVLRLGLLPLFFLLAASVIPMSDELSNVVHLQAAMPAAIFPIVLARVYGGDVRTAVRVSLITSIISLVTMPMWLAAG